MLPLTLANAAIPGGPINVFITDELYNDAIVKAKELLLHELSHILMKTGILQTRDFIAPELYLEYIDTCFRIVWFGMYREYYLELGLTDMSAGKFAAIAKNVTMPLRFLELIEGILAPVLIGKDVFCPSEKLVRCRLYNVDINSSIVWGIPVDRVVGLSERYGFTIRNSIVDRISQFPGAMSTVPDYKDLPIVSRIIKFTTLDKAFAEKLVKEPVEPNPDVLPRGKDLFLTIQEEIETDEASLTHSRLVERYRNICRDIYAPNDENYADIKWFVPFVYNGLPDGDFGRALASYLPLTWATLADVNSRNHGVNFGINSVQLPGTYIPLRGNDRRHPRSYVDLSTICDLRRKEGRLTPLDEDEITNHANLIAAIDQKWFNVSFPSLEDPNMFTQVTWDISYQHPFLAVRSLTRSTKIGTQNKRPLKNKIVKQGNIHGATRDGEIDRQPSD